MTALELKANQPMPSVFVSHGSPMAALDMDDYAASLRLFGQSLAPKAILVISAHWEASGVRIGAAAKPGLIYDFGGFPQSLYGMKYDAPGSPELAADVASTLASIGVGATLDATRGWDHGVWIPLRLMFPAADIPVVEVSLPMNASPQELHRIGAALAGYRERGILILGSGGLVHNLRLFRGFEKGSPDEQWAIDFERWIRERVQRRDLESLFQYAALAPNARLAVPTPEHFAPLFVVLGAAEQYTDVQPIFDRFQYGHMAMHSFALR